MTESPVPAPAAPAPADAAHELPKETLCPSCGKFVGAYTRCPYCGCEHKLRMSIRFFRFFALAVSIVGLFLIWLAARGINAPLVKVKDIGPMNSFAYIRIEGETMRSSPYEDGSMSFLLDDGTGTIRVRAYPDTAKALADLGSLPQAGDRVSVEGTIQFTGDRAQLIVNVPEKITVTPVETLTVTAVAMEIGEVTAAAKGKEVIIVGKVTALSKMATGTTLELADPTGAVDVVIWDSFRDRVVAKGLRLVEGKFLKVQGQVGDYKGKLQVVPKGSGRVEETAVIP